MSNNNIQLIPGLWLGDSLNISSQFIKNKDIKIKINCSKINSKYNNIKKFYKDIIQIIHNKLLNYNIFIYNDIQQIGISVIITYIIKYSNLKDINKIIDLIKTKKKNFYFKKDNFYL